MLASPLKVKLTELLDPSELVELVELEELLLPDWLSRKSIQGTATCLPPVELELLEPPSVLPLEPPLLELGEVELLELGEVELLDVSELPELLELPDGLLEPPVLPELLKDRIAKSIRPEFGLMMQSLIVPNEVPLEPVTCAPVSWLALMSWCPIRPVHPDFSLELPYWLELLDGLELLLPELPLEELCACAPSVKHAAQNTTILSSCFFITCLSCVC